MDSFTTTLIVFVASFAIAFPFGYLMGRRRGKRLATHGRDIVWEAWNK